MQREVPLTVTQTIQTTQTTSPAAGLGPDADCPAIAALNADLHAHSTASDGTLSPEKVVASAVGQGVELFSLTDHDTTSGIAEAREAARAKRLPFVCGVEVSTTFAGKTIHVVGLGIDPEDDALCRSLAAMRAGRVARARAMAEALAAAGHPDTLDEAVALAGMPERVSRTHFARVLARRGLGTDVRAVFQRYLAEGLPGYVKHAWAPLADGVGWIRAAGGVAVLAHPARYRFDPTREWALLEAFREAGGIAIEVCTSVHGPHEIAHYADLARRLSLEASRGSDFHGPGVAQLLPGDVAPLPRGLVPVWHRFV